MQTQAAIKLNSICSVIISASPSNAGEGVVKHLCTTPCARTEPSNTDPTNLRLITLATKFLGNRQFSAHSYLYLLLLSNVKEPKLQGNTVSLLASILSNRGVAHAVN